MTGIESGKAGCIQMYPGGSAIQVLSRSDKFSLDMPFGSCKT